MQAVVMAGGEGTRLRPLTCNRPKPMVPIINRPVMEHIINLLKKQGITEIFVTLYYLPEVIQDYFGDGSDFGVKIKYYTEESPLGTAGSVKQIEKELNDTFVIISGDALTDINLLETINFHKEKNAIATLALTQVDNPLEYGVVITDEDGSIKHFLEKPNWSEVFSDTVNTGIYILEPESLSFFAEGKNFDFSKDLFPMLLEKGYPIYGHLTSGYWCDVGNIEQYRQANMDCLDGKVKVDIPGKMVASKIWMEEGNNIHPTINLKGPVFIGANAQIKEGANIEPYTVLGNNCLVDKTASLKRSILWGNDYIGKNSNLGATVVGENCYLHSHVHVFEGSVLGDHCKIESRAQIKAGIKIWPGKEVQTGISVIQNMVWGDSGGKSLFTCQGVKGLVNVELTPDYMARVGAAYGAFLPKQSTIVVGNDGGRSSEMLRKALVSGLVACGVNVYDLQNLPRPVVKYATNLEEIQGGVYLNTCVCDLEKVEVTFFDREGIDLDKNQLKKIETLFIREDFRKARVEELGGIFQLNGLSSCYAKSLLENLPKNILKNRKLKLVVDYNHSNTCLILPSVLEELGCEVVSLNAYMDEGKSAKNQDEFSHLLKQLSAMVVTTQSDFGVLLDPKGEKVFLVDNKGRIAKDNQVLILLALYRLEKDGQGMIALPVTIPWFMENLLEKYKGKVVRTKANSRALLEKTK